MDPWPFRPRLSRSYSCRPPWLSPCRRRRAGRTPICSRGRMVVSTYRRTGILRASDEVARFIVNPCSDLVAQGSISGGVDGKGSPAKQKRSENRKVYIYQAHHRSVTTELRHFTAWSKAALMRPCPKHLRTKAKGLLSQQGFPGKQLCLHPGIARLTQPFAPRRGDVAPDVVSPMAKAARWTLSS